MTTIQELQQELSVLRLKTKAAWDECARVALHHDTVRTNWLLLDEQLKIKEKEFELMAAREQIRAQVLSEIQAQQAQAVPVSTVTESSTI